MRRSQQRRARQLALVVENQHDNEDWREQLDRGDLYSNYGGWYQLLEVECDKKNLYHDENRLDHYQPSVAGA